MHYIETTDILEMEDVEQKAPQNWIPERRWRNCRNYTEIPPQNTEVPEAVHSILQSGEISPNPTKINYEQRSKTTSGEISHEKAHENNYGDESNGEEDFEMDFLISPGVVFPNRKVRLEDVEISEETRRQFEEMCNRHPGAFSKNNRDIGKTTLIEMEIDTGDSSPVAQNPYTLPLKHHEWVRKEIETLEKAGVIERSLSLWASPVIVVPKKSAPNEPPRRRL